MTTKEQYIAGGYIPYSVRNNIEDKDLAGLLDYLEREMGWKISFQIIEDLNEWHIWQLNDDKFSIHDNGGVIHINCNQEWRKGVSRPAFREMIPELFFATYKTLLPAIRNLYRK